MSMAIEWKEQAVIARPAERVDYEAEASAGFQKVLEALPVQAQASRFRLAVNCAAISYISSAGLRAFWVAARAAKSAGVWFAVCPMAATYAKECYA